MFLYTNNAITILKLEQNNYFEGSLKNSEGL